MGTREVVAAILQFQRDTLLVNKLPQRIAELSLEAENQAW